MSETFQERVARVQAAHKARTGTEARVFQAPGRVNLLGEHTDYSGGFCMPAALSFNTVAGASPRSDDTVCVESLDFNETVSVSLQDLESWRDSQGQGHWSAYVLGVLWSLRERGVQVAGCELTLTGNVPPGSGLSSSASVEVAIATAVLGVLGVTLPKAQVALACQFAENAYVGAPCGIMDQFIAAAGVAHHALAIDTRALTAELAPVPESLRLVVANSMVRHSVGGGEYGERRREVEEAAAAIARIHPEAKQLRDATLPMLEEARTSMSDAAFRRGRHVITDSARVLEGVTALRAGDAARFGELMNEAHRSFRDDFEASCAECDLLVKAAVGLDGCLGSRLTGGGFGGCTVSLVNTDRADAFASELREAYRGQTGIVAQVFVCEIADGAGEAVSA